VLRPTSTTDCYGRVVATVSVGGADVNEALVRAGAAWHYAQYSDSAVLAAAERDARASRRGLWQSASPQAPWLFRSAGQRPATLLSAPAPTTGPFHGNRESKVLHALGCQHYNCKNCTVAFATVAQAQAAGFRVHEECVRSGSSSLVSHRTGASNKQRWNRLITADR